MQLHIGLSYAPSDVPKYRRYEDALQQAASALGYEVTTTDLSNNPSAASTVDAIVFTGGADVEPSRFGKADERGACDEIDEVRDAKEFEFARIADERHLPILGICRGLQLLNIHYGGSLIVDLGQAKYPSHSKIEGKDRRHDVHIEPGSLLKKITRVTNASVTSAHHQAIDEIAPGMVVSARSSADGVIEAIEWKELEKKPYFIAVQWHPERMDAGEPLSGILFEQFLSETAMNKVLGSRF